MPLPVDLRRCRFCVTHSRRREPFHA
jgi:hypothetical protein